MPAVQEEAEREMTEPVYPPQRWIPVLLERTAELMGQVAVLYRVLKTTEAWQNLPEKTRDEIEDGYFTYHCGWAYAEGRKLAESRGELAEFDAEMKRRYDERMRRAEEMLS